MELRKYLIFINISVCLNNDRLQQGGLFVTLSPISRQYTNVIGSVVQWCNVEYNIELRNLYIESISDYTEFINILNELHLKFVVIRSFDIVY